MVCDAERTKTITDVDGKVHGKKHSVLFKRYFFLLSDSTRYCFDFCVGSPTDLVPSGPTENGLV